MVAGGLPVPRLGAEQRRRTSTATPRTYKEVVLDSTQSDSERFEPIVVPTLRGTRPVIGPKDIIDHADVKLGKVVTNQ